MKMIGLSIVLITLVGQVGAQNDMPSAMLLTNLSTHIHIYYGSFLAHADGSFSATQEGGNPLVPQGEDLSGGSIETMGISVGVEYGESELTSFLAAEMGYLSYESESGNINLDTLTFSGLLGIQYAMLKTKAVPDGRIRPYAGVGASLLWGDFDARIMMDDGSVAYGDEVAVGVSLDVRTGLECMVTQKIGIFAEYRFCWLYTGSTSPDVSGGWTSKDYETLEMDLSLGQGVVGVTYYF